MKIIAGFVNPNGEIDIKELNGEEVFADEGGYIVNSKGKLMLDSEGNPQDFNAKIPGMAASTRTAPAEFSVDHLNNGIYQINLKPPGGIKRLISATATVFIPRQSGNPNYGNTLHNAMIVGRNKGFSFTVKTGSQKGVGEDRAFSFIATYED